MLKWINKILKNSNNISQEQLLNNLITKQNYNKNCVINKPSRLIRNQIKNPNTIPVIIINFNQLFYLELLIDFLISKQTLNIVILDNCSTYKPLLDYYKKISKSKNIKIEFQKSNLGHLVFWKNRKIFKKYSRGFFVVTDADIVPNINLEMNYLKQMIDYLFEFPEKTKVGFALSIDNLPEHYALKQNVLKWESKFWSNELIENAFDADIDTTFAIYWPKTDRIFDLLYTSFFNAIRLGGKFQAEHGGWYLNHNNLSEEQKFYFKTANNSNSWKIDENGNLSGSFVNDY